MKVSLSWLQKYFAEPLPLVSELSDVLTFHSSEVEEIVIQGNQTMMDVKILPDRAPYALSHRGVAFEIAASMGTALQDDPLRSPLPEYPEDTSVQVQIEDDTKCVRYMAARITGVKIGPSPDWLKEALQTVGQRSINNVVDATNYVLLNIGQPLHAFDAAKISGDEISILVRGATEGEKITTLTSEEYALPAGTLLITDSVSGTPLGIAGVKGGKAAEITEDTTDILIESANFEGSAIRKTSQALKLWTDASLRFQNKISPELAAYGMRDVIALITEIAGGKVQGVVDVYPNPETPSSPVTTSLGRINGLLGTSFSMDEVASALNRLSLEHVVEGETFTVRPPFERRDIVIWQDLAEEIGRVIGYESVTPTPLPVMENAPDQARFAGIERVKDVLREQGFVEVSTQAFAPEGDIILSNPLQQDRPWLRASLVSNMEDTLTRAVSIAPRTLGPEASVKLFELGNVFTKDAEYLSLALGYRALTGKELPAVLASAADALLSTFPTAGIKRPQNMNTNVVELSLKDVAFESIGNGYIPQRINLSAYQSFSLYPSALRDIAVWTPEGTKESEVSLLIQKYTGTLLVRMDQFDRFEKEGRISYAFRLVFQANDRTLADTDIDPVMEEITKALNEQENWEVR